ncbi:hypothetical protein [Streptomyces sp. WAC06614]|uniref:hypothetical protein n=1 Tax=Streptomyces sp. WAC06614 TaxID=2487416 RepID=UPI0028ADFAC8|nr:hypothetical protein [Streptomyces sp. WAC06614]
MVHAALDTILDAHLAVEDTGLVAVDLYDGCMLHDFEEGRIRLCDLDEYRQGHSRWTPTGSPAPAGTWPPEEFVRGSVIDIRTTVFTRQGAAAPPRRRRRGEAVAR